MVLIGPRDLRFVAYPISAPDPDSGLATINWIAEQKFAPDDRWNKEDWSREASKEDFLPRFEDFRFDWLNVPDLIRKAGTVFEYPMVDRDPLKRWTVGNATLLGDAAHPAYPVGSNGAGSAILDARKLGHFFLKHGVNAEALAAYEAKMRPVTSNVTLANRKAGPDSIIDIVEKKCTGGETDVEEVISQQELQDHAGKYKALAGVSVSMTNEALQTIAAGVKIQM